MWTIIDVWLGSVIDIVLQFYTLRITYTVDGEDGALVEEVIQCIICLSILLLTNIDFLTMGVA